MKRLSEKVKRLRTTPYQKVAAKFSTTENYVSQIATGARVPQRGKGLLIKKELEKLTQ